MLSKRVDVILKYINKQNTSFSKQKRNRPQEIDGDEDFIVDKFDKSIPVREG
jgi:hypothetical protein